MYMYLEVPRSKGEGLHKPQRMWAESAGSWSTGYVVGICAPPAG